jgi:hypothetical protein
VRIVVDALQVAPTFSGVGRQVREIGGQLHDLPPDLRLELRCAADAVDALAPAFPAGTLVRTPIRSSRPRWRRILHQQFVAPLRDGTDTLLVCLGDQAPLWGRARRLVVVNDVRRLTTPETAGGLEGLFYRLLVPRAARRAHVVVTISEFSRQEIARVLGLDAPVVAHHPRPVASEPPRREGRIGLLVVGAQRSYKGRDTVVEALRLLDDPPDVTFAGEGGPAGWVGDEELERLYATAVATVSPSTYEGYGFPVADSLARGLPTIASDIPPHREIGGDAVLYFPPGNATALAACIRELPTRWEELAAAALTRARHLAEERPTWRDVILGSASLVFKNTS